MLGANSQQKSVRTGGMKATANEVSSTNKLAMQILKMNKNMQIMLAENNALRQRGRNVNSNAYIDSGLETEGCVQGEAEKVNWTNSYDQQRPNAYNNSYNPNMRYHPNLS